MLPACRPGIGTPPPRPIPGLASSSPDLGRCPAIRSCGRPTPAGESAGRPPSEPLPERELPTARAFESVRALGQNGRPASEGRRMTLQPGLMLACMLGIGFLAQWLAWRVKLPAILFLLLAGIVLGPVTGVFRPDAMLG